MGNMLCQFNWPFAYWVCTADVGATLGTLKEDQDAVSMLLMGGEL